jgi:hypothetical protein
MRFAMSVVLGALLLGTAATAHAFETLGEEGHTGYAEAVEPARCISHFSPSGRYLGMWVPSPNVKGVNWRRGRKDYTRVRFQVYLVDYTSHETLWRSGWSAALRVSDRRLRTWAGQTGVQAGIGRSYKIDVRVEWRRRGSLQGWWAYRIDDWRYWDSYNQGPFGPFDGCAALNFGDFPNPDYLP